MNFQAIFDEAHANGISKVESCEEKMLKIKGYAPQPFPGIAHINIGPSNNAFVRWLRENSLVNPCNKDNYYSGDTFWISMFNQSRDKKAAYAYGFASVLQKYQTELKLKKIQVHARGIAPIVC